MAVDPKFAYYLRQAQEAAAMARQISNEDTRRVWLELARDWLRMIPREAITDTEHFDQTLRDLGTGQEQSEANN